MYKRQAYSRLAAETDIDSAARSDTLKLMRGEPIFVPRPEESMDGLWTEAEQFLVGSRLGAAVISGPDGSARVSRVVARDER